METVAVPGALFESGLRLLNRGESEPAIAAFQRCLAEVPDHPGALYNLGTALLQAGRDADALAAFLACLGQAPDFGKAYVNLADTLRRLTLFNDAEAMAEIGLQHLPDSPEAGICLAHVLTEKGEYARAAAQYRRVLDRTPNHAGVHSNLANILLSSGHIAEAVAMHDRAAALDPAEPNIRFNRGMALLQTGDFQSGWDDYEARWSLPRCLPRRFGEPWQGQDIAGRTILLHAEQGLGDTLQFVRYAPMVAERGARVVLEVQPPLVGLLRQLPGIAHVLGQGVDRPPFDIHCPLLSLPRAFATRLDTIPAKIPYLHADPDAAASWSAMLPADQSLRVGLIWAGSPRPEDPEAHLTDRRRSLALRQLTPLAAIPGVHFISLQKDRPDPAVQEARTLRLIDPMPQVADFADTAALIATLDLVISADTSVAHLAGAMGRPVWLLSRYDTCWRWLHSRQDSPWYPTMRIYRQDRPLDWSGAIGRIGADLAALARTAGNSRRQVTGQRSASPSGQAVLPGE